MHHDPFNSRDKTPDALATEKAMIGNSFVESVKFMVGSNLAVVNYTDALQLATEIEELRRENQRLARELSAAEKNIAEQQDDIAEEIKQGEIYLKMVKDAQKGRAEIFEEKLAISRAHCELQKQLAAKTQSYDRLIAAVQSGSSWSKAGGLR